MNRTKKKTVFFNTYDYLARNWCKKRSRPIRVFDAFHSHYLCVFSYLKKFEHFKTKIWTKWFQQNNSICEFKNDSEVAIKVLRCNIIHGSSVFDRVIILVKTLLNQNNRVVTIKLIIILNIFMKDEIEWLWFS